jgi:CRP/FNR family transcriptional regulator, cyclic AMP receptor protein
MITRSNVAVEKALFLLSEMAEDDWDWLMATGQRLYIQKNHVLVRQGKPIDGIYILLTGILSVSVDLPKGHEQREIARLTSGEVVGEISFVDDRPPAATVTSMTRALLLYIHKDELLAKINADKEFGLRFYRAMAYFLADRLRQSVVGQPSYLFGTPKSPAQDEANAPHLNQARFRLATLIKALRGY